VTFLIQHINVLIILGDYFFQIVYFFYRLLFNIKLALF